MKNLAAILATLLLVAFATSQSGADDYVYRSGYWYYPGSHQAYYRSLHTTPGYWDNYGRYHPSSSYYHYHAYTPPAAATYAPAASYDWKKQILDIKAGEMENEAYNKALATLGPVRPQLQLGYGQATVPPYVLDGHYQSQHYQGLYGTNATTRYGYLDAAALNLNPVINLDQRLQQFGQITTNAQSVASKTTDDFGSLIAQAGGGQQRLAEIIAKGQVIAQIAKALDGPPTATSQQYTFRQTPQGVQVQVVPTQPTNPVPFQAPRMPPVNERAEALANHLQASCVSCHSPTVKKGGFDASTYFQLSAEQKKGVRDYVTAKKCPQVPGGGPGVPLTQAQIDLYE